MPVDQHAEAVSYKQLCYFFLPLGLSATLVTLSHVIINSTLARSVNPELIIASYALPMSLLALTERPAVLLRQTCSALVRDRISFRSMAAVSSYVFASMLVLGFLIAFTPIGKWLFQYIFGVEAELLGPIIDVYRILMFVSVFSGLRCLFHGIIIFNLRTKWLTIGMFIRLVGMYLLSLYFIHRGPIESGEVGAIIFLVGMIIEASVSVWEGRSLLRKVIPEKAQGHPIETKSQIFGFYKPLLISSLIAIIVGPAINAMLGKTMNIHLAIASFAIAGSLAQLVQSFFSYMHQIVLNFYPKDPKAVKRFTLFVAFIPSVLIAVLGYTSLGPWFMMHVMGVNNELMQASLRTLRVFMILTLVFPWLDFVNGIIMLKGQTMVMIKSQAVNVIVTIAALIISVIYAPGWNGSIGALAQSLGSLSELCVVLYVLKVSSSARERLVGQS
jgi:hypothetical protein